MIKAEGVTKLYGNQRALNDVTFEVGTGEVVGFLGPNGAGKSTMMKILTGFISPSSGNVWIDGLAVGRNNTSAKQLIGYLPENNPIYHDMYVNEYLEFVCGFYPLISNKIKTVRAVIEMTGLGAEQHKKIGALSKGYRQRVGLAQAIIPNPKVLILDEPTTGLDPNQLVEVRKLIMDLGKEKTVILSSHIMQEVEAMCHSAIIINQGEIKVHAPVAQLSAQGKGTRILELEFQQGPVPASLFEHKSILEIEQLSASNYRILTNSEDVRPIIFARAVEAGVVLVGLKEQGGTLEDVFRSITS